jgi:thiamine-monophosphate kinase
MFEDRDKKLTPIQEIGEFGLIEHLAKHVKLINKSTVKGIGDDAAVIDYKNKKTLISTDMLVEGVHFDITYVPLKHLGYKAAVVNFSDIMAMNALPRQITVSIAVSSRVTVEAIEEIYAGIMLACDRYQVDLVGGDTTSSTSGIVISITVLGEADDKQITYRDTAKEGDLICVTGDLGAAYMGLQLLEREKAVFKEDPDMQPDLAGCDYLLERQLKPEARADIIPMLQELKVVPTSMIDISDGLASEAIHICRQSGTGCSFYEEKIPIDQLTYDTAREFNLDPTMCAMNGGEDYELLLTIKPADHEKFKNNPDITIIGHITDKNSGYQLIAKNGTQHPINAQGWDALLKKDLEG